MLRDIDKFYGLKLEVFASEYPIEATELGVNILAFKQFI